MLRQGCTGDVKHRPLPSLETKDDRTAHAIDAGVRWSVASAWEAQRGKGRSLPRQPDRGADTGFEDGVGLCAVGSGACELQRTGEEPKEGRRVSAADLPASP
jgi:hypothetical protein